MRFSTLMPIQHRKVSDVSDHPTNASHNNANWELRQKHASFYQTLVSSAQQAAISAATSVSLILTLGAAMTKLSGVPESQDWNILLIAVFAWGISSTIMVIGFSRSAKRIDMDYRSEHARIFPGHDPYRLESFLLDFAGRNPKLVGTK